MTIQTYKNIPFDISEHAYCKALWKCDTAVAAGGVLPCSVSSANDVTLPGGATLNANGMSLDFVAGANAWAGMDLTGKDWIVGFSGKIGTGVGAAFGVGNVAAAQQGITFPGSGSIALTANSILGDSATGSTARVADGNLHNQFAVYDADGNALTSIDATLATPGADDVATTIGEVTAGAGFPTGEFTEVYAIAIFAWTAGSLPANYADTMLWWFNEIRNGRKVLPPWWRGTS